MKRKARALGMISGGLDSQLAVAVMRGQGVEVTGLHFLNGFGAGSLRKIVSEKMTLETIAEEKSEALESMLSVPVRVLDVSGEFLGVLSSPRFGYGRNINPCIDCRIFLLRKAREIMEAEGYDFVFTGEVLGQRPMSQHLVAMKQVEKESGLAGRLLRPLSARLLAETLPEKEGLVDREKLLDIQGRSRKRQMALAAELGIEDYAAPAGGCTLTDANYARKYLDLERHAERITREDAVMLSMGRHLRLSESVKIVVGRRELENDYLESTWGDGILLTTLDHPGPVTVVIGDPTEEELMQAAAVTARYSDGKLEASVRVSISAGGEEAREVEVAPALDTDLDRWRI